MVIGKFLISTIKQGLGAPVVDKCTSFVEGFDKQTGKVTYSRTYHGYAIHLTPWRRNKYGEIKEGLALVIGWKTRP